VTARPVAELAARAGALRGVFCDVDDTLTHDGALVPEAYAAVVALARAGLRVVPVTGRPAGYAQVLAAMWPVDAAVAENGAVAYVRRAARELEAFYWDDAEARAVQRARLAALRDDLCARFAFARVADDQWLRVCDLAFDVGERQKLDEAQILALKRAIEAAGARSVVSTVHAHAYLGDHDKARMLVRLGRALWQADLDADREAWLFVGDSPNDAAGFAHFPISAGPSNAAGWNMTPGPAYVSAFPGGHGFADIARVVLSAR
jgi:HAD superfamily hydrolase (TIGR01484 family)